MNVSIKTIKFHLLNIFKRLKVKSSRQLCNLYWEERFNEREEWYKEQLEAERAKYLDKVISLKSNTVQNGETIGDQSEQNIQSNT